MTTVEFVNQGKTKSFAPNLPVTIKSTEAVSFHSFKEFLTISHLISHQKFGVSVIDPQACMYELSMSRYKYILIT